MVPKALLSWGQPPSGESMHEDIHVKWQFSVTVSRCLLGLASGLD